jgi:hypothetical protein
MNNNMVSVNFLNKDGKLKERLFKLSNNQGFVIIINEPIYSTHIKYTYLERKTMFVECFYVNAIGMVIKSYTHHLTEAVLYDEWIHFISN